MTEQKELKTTKMEGETESQYTAWLLYCEYGSIDKLLRAWEGIALKRTEVAPELAGIMERLGKPAGRRTIADWSKKFRWVERTDLKLAEDLESLREKTKKIKREKIHKIAEYFKAKIEKAMKQMIEGEGATTHDVKEAWEMFQVELGKPTSRTALEEQQRPPTPEEKEQAKLIDEAIKPILTKTSPHPSGMDREAKNKKRKGRTD